MLLLLFIYDKTPKAGKVSNVRLSIFFGQQSAVNGSSCFTFKTINCCNRLTKHVARGALELEPNRLPREPLSAAVSGGNINTAIVRYNRCDL